jgi:hypothetical protein
VTDGGVPCCGRFRLMLWNSFVISALAVES